MRIEILNAALDQVEFRANSTRWGRFFAAPIPYIFALTHRELAYRFTKKEAKVTGETFFGAKMRLSLPSGTDIYLTGGKTHQSEIRLARFMINSIKQGDCFLDIGAHYGYFTLLAEALVSSEGKVVTIEASPANFSNLKLNTAAFSHIQAYNQLASDRNSTACFYEFPNLYSEYNSIDIDQFRNQDWFQKNQPTEIALPARRIDDFLKEIDCAPQFIKIDVEGAESLVINGLSSFIKEHSPVFMMEVLPEERGNASHIQAINTLNTIGYVAYSINEIGQLEAVSNVGDYIKSNNLDSDNIVLKR